MDFFGDKAYPLWLRRGKDPHRRRKGREELEPGYTDEPVADLLVPRGPVTEQAAKPNCGLTERVMHFEPGTIIEINELQHFASFRLRSFDYYPGVTPWISRPRSIKNSAVNALRMPTSTDKRRPRQRAYYDSLRDVATPRWDTQQKGLVLGAGNQCSGHKRGQCSKHRAVTAHRLNLVRIWDPVEDQFQGLAERLETEVMPDNRTAVLELKPCGVSTLQEGVPGGAQQKSAAHRRLPLGHLAGVLIELIGMGRRTLCSRSLRIPGPASA